MDTDSNSDAELKQSKAREESIARELGWLFGDDIVAQARLLDVADINLSDDMTSQIADGIRQLKHNRQKPETQKHWLQQQEAGLQLLLCLWIMDMDLLKKIQVRPYLQE